jgi:hypothetical protein
MELPNKILGSVLTVCRYHQVAMSVGRLRAQQFLGNPENLAFIVFVPLRNFCFKQHIIIKTVK